MATCRAVFAGARFASPLYRFTSRVGYRRSAPVRAVLEEVVVIRDEEDPAIRQAPPTTEPLKPPPALADREKFRLHWSVDMWRDFNPRSWLSTITDDSAPVSDRLQAFTETLSSAVSTSGALSSPQATQYWAYHLARSGFFAVQAIAGLAATRFTSSQNGGSSDKALSRFEQVARNGWQGPLSEAMLSYYQDFENIKEGKYKLPWDMDLTHRQFNPLFILRRGVQFMTEATDTLARRERGYPDDVWFKSAFLPKYYDTTFHYQSDGWLSSRSAQVYESSTETLFVGRQDAMQRSTLVPIAEFMAGKDPSQIRALEIASGTGRFATFVKDNYPEMDLTESDLSPFYLQAGRDNMRYWKRKRAADAILPGVDGNGTTFLQAAAEKLPSEDNSFDLVYCVYLFHELPEDIRKKAVQEMARVVKPGGMVVLTDSVQLGDRPCYDATLGGFKQFNEPYYENYLQTNLGELFQEAGLECDLKVMSSTTKTLSFKKPLNKQPAESSLNNATETVSAGSNIDSLCKGVS